ncbi:MAG: hypothetical protein VX346_20335 [Planctomycetota bacterium]|nr:hypothetical protein [Planctomycetota bacterium]
MSEPKPLPTARQPRIPLTRKLVYSCLITGSLCLSVEYVSRWIIGDKPTQATAESLHTEYDPQIGWINKADFFAADLYGADKHLQTNSQRLRAADNYSQQPPLNKIRLICSGDSFTLGYGVGNQYTWCAQLEALDPRIQTVNMGQGGYGVDQAYLWYQTMKSQLRHHVHVFSFISMDFMRATRTEFLGYGKPLLRVNDNRLQVTNVPVPNHDTALRKWIDRSGTFRLLRSFRSRIQNQQNSNQHAEELAVYLFNQLKREHHAENRTLVLVHLPLRDDYFRGADSWRRFLQTQARTHSWIYIDLLAGFRELALSDIESMYLGHDLPFAGAAGHYNEKGNRFVAELLLPKLMEIPLIREHCHRLTAASGRTSTAPPTSSGDSSTP